MVFGSLQSIRAISFPFDPQVLKSYHSQMRFLFPAIWSAIWIFLGNNFQFVQVLK